MNRQRIRVIALAALVVAAGAYVWAQRSASTVKPARTANAAVKKPGALVPPTKTSAPAARGATPVAPASKGVVPATPAPAAVPPKTAAAVPAKTTAPAVPLATQKAPAPAASVHPAPVAAAPLLPAVPVEATSWQDPLQKGAYLAEKLRPRLPEGTDLVVASSGFRDLQQFVAAVTASHNLKLNFDELKRRVVTDKKGLAFAIDAMKKVASATIEEQRAEYEARGLIQEAKRQPAPVAPAAKAAPSKPQPKKSTRTQSGV